MVAGVLSSSISAYGYIYAGIKAPAIHNRGTLVLMVDSTFSDSCALALANLMYDLRGDGWQLIRHDVPRSLTDAAVKAIITNDYNTQPDVKAVLLVGHIAVPYSGKLNPDGHPDHLGAWPADVYYATMPGSWTDVSVNDTSSWYPLNDNIPGDGKWDQTTIPGSVVLQVSRIDFYNMPAFAPTEVQLMNNYLSKNHTYKMDSLPVRHRALVYDNFGWMGGEAFAANGWRNFPPLVGTDSVAALPFIPSLAGSSYQWAYGTGPGSFTSAGGIGSTTDFVTNPVNGIFTMLFGSYFGDWNVQNNFLRAPLCAPTPALTSCWAGRPNWFFHHMALGENIGYSTLLTQNAMYTPANYGGNWVHVALMGDLALRTDYIKPISNLVITKPYKNGAILNWTASPDASVIGYYVYRADSAFGYYKRVSPMVAGTTFHDSVGKAGLKYYMVRPVKLQSTPSGAYYNLGVGRVDTGTITFSTVGVPVLANAVNITVFPNPAESTLGVNVDAEAAYTATMYIMGITGERFNPVTRELQAGANIYRVDVSALPAGVYMLCVQAGGRLETKKWVKM
jgi:hypothetical protein